MDIPTKAVRTDNSKPPHIKPERCTYIVRFWMKNVGYGRQERDAMNALQAGHDVFDLLIKAYPDACVVVVGIVRK